MINSFIMLAVYTILLTLLFPLLNAQCQNEEKIGENCDIDNLCYQNTPDTSDIMFKTCICTDCDDKNKTLSSNCEYKYAQEAYQEKNLQSMDEENANPCDFEDTPCLDANSCLSKNDTGDFICTKCPFGKFGAKCEHTNYCFMSDEQHEKIECVNGVCSTCLNRIPNSGQIDFHCRCAMGYVGKNCKLRNHCLPSEDSNEPVCKNNGTCTPLSIQPHYKCTCPGGFNGPKCELKDPCFFQGRNVCPSGQECVRRNNEDYFCREISLCRLDPENSKYPCTHKGLCSIESGDGVNTSYKYQCNCTDTGYIGSVCQHRVGDFSVLFPTEVDAGVENEYFIFIKDTGDYPLYYIVMGEGFTTSLGSSNFELIDDSVVSETFAGRPRGTTRAFSFSHIYPMPGRFRAAVGQTNGARKFDKSLLSRVDETFITVVDVEPCLPHARIINAAAENQKRTIYRRASRFVISVVLLGSNCTDNIPEFRWKWHHITKDWRLPRPQNVLDLKGREKDTHLVFEPRSLLYGRYVITVELSLNVDGRILRNQEKAYIFIGWDYPRISLQGGSQRSVNPTEELVLDASKSQDISFPESTPFLEYQWSCIEPKPCLLGPWKKPIVKLPPFTLNRGTTYKFKIKVRSPQAEKTSEEIQTIIPSNFQLDLTCEKNCERFNPGDEVVMKCLCSNCRKQPEVFNFTWKSVGQDTPEIMTIENNLVVYILPKYYTRVESFIVCNAILKDNLILIPNTNIGAESTAKFSLEVNTPPVKGSCKINPPRGVFLKDQFDINCKDFEDPHEPLTYSFYANLKPGVVDSSTLLLFHDTNPNAVNMYLPLGKENNSFMSMITVRVTDNYGLSRDINISADVEAPSPDLYPQLIDDLILKNGSEMNKRFEAGNDQGGIQIQLLVLQGLLEDETMREALDSSQLLELHRIISETLVKVPLHSAKTVEQILNVLKILIDSRTNVTTSSESLRETSETIFKVAQNLTNFVEENTEVIKNEDIDSLVKVAVGITSRIMRQGHRLRLKYVPASGTNQTRDVLDYDEEDDVARDYFFDLNDQIDELEGLRLNSSEADKAIKDLASVTRHAFLTLETLLDVAGKRRVENIPFDISDENVVVFVESLRNIATVNYTIDGPTNGTESTIIKITNNLQAVLDSEDIKEITVEIIQIHDINPFFDDTSAAPSTPIVSLTVKDSKSKLPIRFVHTESPIELFLPLTNQSKEILNGSRFIHTEILLPLSELDEDEIPVHHLTLPYNSRVEVILEAPNGLEFLIAITKDYRPQKFSFCQNSTIKLPNKDGEFHVFFDTEIINITTVKEEELEEFLDYYVGIYVFDPENKVADHGDLVTFSVYFTRTSCLFRDEDRNFWSEKGCLPGDKTNATHLHCLCSHASIFSGTQFVIPSVVESLSILDFDLQDLKSNPFVLIVVCVVLLVYIIGGIVCNYFDRKDKRRHVGITIMAEFSENFNESYYLVTVVTGNQWGAGSTAHVSMQLYGNNGRSEIYTMRDTKSSVLYRGGIDTLLVSSEKDLGELEKIRIWHDNTGSSPQWFCQRIFVRNIKTDREWIFFIDRWLSVGSRKSPTLVVEQVVASKSEQTKFTRCFNQELSDQFYNSHLWVSVFGKPPSSRFNRLQRLTCAFVVLTSYMFINLVFYRVSSTLDDIETLVDVGDTQINILTFIVSMQQALCAVPVGVIIVLLFRRIRERYIPTLIIWKNQPKDKRKSRLHDPNILIPSAHPKHRRTTYKPGFDILGQPTTLLESHDEDSDKKSTSSSNFSIPSTDIKELETWIAGDTKREKNILNLTGRAPDSFIHALATGDDEETTSSLKSDRQQLDILMDTGRQALIHRKRANEPSSFIFKGDHEVPQVERLIDEELRGFQNNPKPVMSSLLQRKKSQNPKKKKKKRVTIKDLKEIEDQRKKSSVAGDKLLKEEQLLKTMESTGVMLEMCQMQPLHKLWCYFPWWFVYVAYGVAWSAMGVFSYFTVVWSLNFGYLRSLDWLAHVSMSFFQSLFIIQPMRVYIMSFIYATVFKRNRFFDEERFQILVKTEDDAMFRQFTRKPMDFEIFRPQKPHLPISGPQFLRMKVDAIRKNVVRKNILLIVLYILLLAPMTYIVHTGYSDQNFYVAENIREMLTLSKHYNSKVNADPSKFQKIRDTAGMISYFEKTLIPALHPTKLYNGDRIRYGRFDAIRMSDNTTMILGVPRIRQLRVVNDSCTAPTSLQQFVQNCFHDYSHKVADRATYNPSWKPAQNKTRVTVSPTNDIWKYRSANETGSYGRQGELAYYDGGGYVVLLGRTFRETYSVIRYLKRINWFDQQTRAVIIEFTTFSPEVNVFCDAFILIELGAAGALYMSSSIQPMILYHSDGLATDAEPPLIHPVIGCYILSAIVLLLLLIVFLYSIGHSPSWKVYRYSWFWLDLIMISLTAVTLTITLQKLFVISELFKRIDQMKINDFLSLQTVTFWYGIEASMVCLTQAFCFFRIWKLVMHSESKFMVTSLMLKLSYESLSGYVILIGTFLTGFAWMGFVAFGNSMEAFHTVWTSYASLFDELLSVDFYQEVYETNRVIGPVYSIAYALFVFLLVFNILIAILDEGLADAKRVTATRRDPIPTVLDSVANLIRKVIPVTWMKRQRKIHKRDGLSIPPNRLTKMKEIAKSYLLMKLAEYDKIRMTEMITFVEKRLQGTKLKLKRREKKSHSQVQNERFEEMRILTLKMMKAKTGAEMNVDELKKYHEVHMRVLTLKLKKLEEKGKVLVDFLKKL